MLLRCLGHARSRPIVQRTPLHLLSGIFGAISARSCPHLRTGLRSLFATGVLHQLTAGEEKIVDLLVEVRQAGEEAAFLVHVEAQSYTEADFPRRMFFYFARLYQKYLQRIYPIVVFSFDRPYREEPSTHIVEFPHRKILEFQFEPIQLNRLQWRDFLHQPNPVAAALMSKMQIVLEDRPKVKVECLRMLATLRLDPARMRLLSGFIDTYLKLSEREEQEFQSEIARIEPTAREGVMEIVTSWMEQGIERGIERGIEQGERLLLRLQLEQKVGTLPEHLRDRLSQLDKERLERLAISLLNFTSIRDLEAWLAENF